jgi:undecaprenyl pyrophosphate synthase
MKMGWDNAPWLIDVSTILLFVIILLSQFGRKEIKEVFLAYRQRQHRFGSI